MAHGDWIVATERGRGAKVSTRVGRCPLEQNAETLKGRQAVTPAVPGSIQAKAAKSSLVLRSATAPS